MKMIELFRKQKIKKDRVKKMKPFKRYSFFKRALLLSSMLTIAGVSPACNNGGSDSSDARQTNNGKYDILYDIGTLPECEPIDWCIKQWEEQYQIPINEKGTTVMLLPNCYMLKVINTGDGNITLVLLNENAKGGSEISLPLEDMKTITLRHKEFSVDIFVEVSKTNVSLYVMPVCQCDREMDICWSSGAMEIEFSRSMREDTKDKTVSYELINCSRMLITKGNSEGPDPSKNTYYAYILSPEGKVLGSRKIDDILDFKVDIYGVNETENYTISGKFAFGWMRYKIKLMCGV